MNNTNKTCPPNKMFNGILMTDYRPNKTLYTNVQDSNKFRKYLQNNAEKLMETERRSFGQRMGCDSEMTYKSAGKNLKPYGA